MLTFLARESRQVDKRILEPMATTTVERCRRGKAVIVWGGLLAVLSLPACRSRPLLEEDFRTAPWQRGWRQAHQGLEVVGEWDAAAGTISLATGQWQSPDLPLVPQLWYRVTVRSRGLVDGHLSLTYFDGRRTQLRCDQYELLPAAADWQESTFYMRAHADAASGQLRLVASDGGQASFEVDRVVVAVGSAAEAAAWADQVYAMIPPLAWAPPADRLARLPKTATALQAGGRLRVLFLGDSIASDTSTSTFDALLERAVPGLDMEVVVSVRGGTGCTYYRQPGRVEQYVLRYRPDLVIVAGISHGMDAEAIGEVLAQIRAGSDADLLVMTGAVADDAVYEQSWRGSAHRDQQRQRLAAFRARLPEVAAQHGAAFFDLRTAWDDYVDASGWPAQRFRRDAIHASTLGRQVLARLLLAFFTPDGAGAKAGGDGKDDWEAKR